MAERVTIDRPFEPVEVDLWGSVYRTKKVVRSVSRRIAEKESELDALPNTPEADDRAVVLIGEILDDKLEGPLDDDGEVKASGKTKPSTLIKRKWNADELSSNEVFAFLMQLGLAEQEATGRPF